MRTVFFGTPHFAVPTLDALVAAGHAPVLVISQPDRPVGRGRRLVSPPVAEAARALGLELAQPERVKDEAFMSTLAALAPDLAVVVAYGQIFRRNLLDLPRLGCINLHASLLPRWRGAAPIQAAIAAGDPRTGVTTMQMDTGLDSGPILLRETVDIGEHETSPELALRLATLGAPLIVRTLEGLAEGAIEPEVQPEGDVTLAPRLAKADGEVDWRRPARAIYDRWRGYQPWPGTTAYWGGEALKLINIRPSDQTTRVAPGRVLEGIDDNVEVACGGGTVLNVLSVQRPGRSAVAARAWLHGERSGADTAFDPLSSMRED